VKNTGLQKVWQRVSSLNINPDSKSHIVGRNHFLLLASYLNVAIGIGSLLARLASVTGSLVCIVFFFLFLGCNVMCLLIVKKSRLIGRDVYLRCCFGGVFTAIPTLGIILLINFLALPEVLTLRIYFLETMLVALAFGAGFLLFYSGAYVPATTIESLKLEVTINLQMLYVFLLAFVTGIAGSLYSQVLAGAQFGAIESIGLFYGTVGFVILVIAPQGRVIAQCAVKLREVEGAHPR
jgi:hypothetical protein